MTTGFVSYWLHDAFQVVIFSAEITIDLDRNNYFIYLFIYSFIHSFIHYAACGAVEYKVMVLLRLCLFVAMK